MHTPEITFVVVEHSPAEGPHGAEGVGEICSIPTMPAIASAIGVCVDRLPVDQEKIAMEMTSR